MKRYVILLVPIITAFYMFSCESENNIPSIGTGSLISHSPCKSDKTTLTTYEVADTVTCVEYAYNPDTKKLSITHINAGFNCCPGELSCEVTLSADTIIIEEKEEEGLCSCLCLYDVTILIENVSASSYWIKFNEPYWYDEKLTFPVNLNSENEGSYCSNRNNYPWVVF